MKRCLIVPDSFKGSLSSMEICEIVRERVLHHFPNCDAVAFPVADGGEGTVDCFLSAMPDGERVSALVSGPFGEPVTADYARFGSLAVVEMASAAGLSLAEDRKDPLRASTRGVGELIRHAVEHGAQRIIIGLGGSCTNDGGCGCAAALGARFTKEDGEVFVPTGGTLQSIAGIEVDAVRQLLQNVEITAICDVTAPLFGPQGAAFVFGPQKGADSEMVRKLDCGLQHLDRMLQLNLHCFAADAPGAGAAGGFGAGVTALMNGELKPGIETVLDLMEFDRLLAGADLVLTGEGRLDGQSLQGKVVLGIVHRAKRQGVPVVAVAGDVADDAKALYDLGLAAAFSINRVALPFSQARLRSGADLAETVDNLLRLWRIASESWSRGGTE